MRTVTLGVVITLFACSLAACDVAPEDQSGDSIVAKQSAFTTGFTFHNYQTGYCLAFVGGPSDLGTYITWRCDDSASQAFMFRGSAVAGSPYGDILNLIANDRCMYGGQNVGMRNNPCFDVDTGTDVVYEDWQLSAALMDGHGHVCYNLLNKSSPGSTLGVTAGSTKEGTSVIMWQNYNDPVNHPDQFWCAY